MHHSACSYKEEALGDYLQREKGDVLHEQRLEWWGHKPKNAGSQQKLKEAGDGFFCRPSRRSVVLVTPWFGIL